MRTLQALILSLLLGVVVGQLTAQAAPGREPAPDPAWRAAVRAEVEAAIAELLAGADSDRFELEPLQQWLSERGLQRLQGGLPRPAEHAEPAPPGAAWRRVGAAAASAPGWRAVTVQASPGTAAHWHAAGLWHCAGGDR